MAPVDFRAALKRQLGFLARSCQSFDTGHHDEAIRIAQCIRVLMHDTNRQKSVLTHLNAKQIVLTSSCLDIASKIRPGTRALVFLKGLEEAGCPILFAHFAKRVSDGDFVLPDGLYYFRVGGRVVLL